MEQNREVLVREYWAADVGVRDFLFRAGEQVVSIEALVRELEDCLVRAEVLDKFDDPVIRQVSVPCPNGMEHEGETTHDTPCPSLSSYTGSIINRSI